MRTGLVVAMALVFAVAFSGIARAEDAKITGVVQVTKDDEGKVTAIKVKADDKVVTVNLDENGQKLAELDGKKVEVTGAVEKKGEEEVVTVKEFKAVE